MQVVEQAPSLTATPAAYLPPLENGERLRSGEFLRRYEAMPEVKKAELVEGKVYMGSPVRADLHAEPDGLIHLWLATYASRSAGVKFYPNTTLLLDADNTFQPDAVLCLPPERGGRTRINAKGYLTGAPELVAEIAASSASLDLQEKLHVYRRCGVNEYLVWRTAENRFDWFLLEDEDYHPQTLGPDGLLRSRVFVGLTLDPAALLARDGARLLASLAK
ncbi:MAG: Uma2 family endonuclease [Verrucomicrobia bacterium]|nr:Uma2 family endonuclease [Verrucomicrobiota bacterium]